MAESLRRVTQHHYAWLPEVLEKTAGSNLADVDPDNVKAIDTFEA